MHVQSPHLPVAHRAQVLSALAAIAVAGGAYGVIALATSGDESTPLKAPVVPKVDTSRALDGSAILRGTANRVDTSRVLDGSPVLRGVASAAPTAAPIVTLPSTMRRPEGFHAR